ncbi:MAG: cytochrome c biogenesis protein CcdA [Methanotrichaceae archaeon]
MHAFGLKTQLSMLILISLLALPLLTILASASTEIILLKSPGCPKCAAAERTIDGIMAEDKNVTLVKYDYFTDDGHRIIKEYKVKSDIPSVIIGHMVIGYKSYNGDTAKLDRMIRDALANTSTNESILQNTTHNLTSSNQTNQSINLTGGISDITLGQLSLSTVSMVLAAGLIAGFNPCLLGILVFLAASVLSSAGRKRELITMIISFSLGIFTMYFLFGLGMQRLLQGEALESGFRNILVVFLVVLGVANVEDWRRLRSGKNSLFRTDWALKYVKSGVTSGKHSSYFLIGALFSLVKAPCVGAVYLAILDLISSKSYFEGSVYLLFYNIGIILPIIILGGFIALGMSPQQIDAFRKDYRAGIRLVTGIALLALAPLIYWQLI